MSSRAAYVDGSPWVHIRRASSSDLHAELRAATVPLLIDSCMSPFGCTSGQPAVVPPPRAAGKAQGSRSSCLCPWHVSPGLPMRPAGRSVPPPPAPPHKSCRYSVRRPQLTPSRLCMRSLGCSPWPASRSASPQSCRQRSRWPQLRSSQRLHVFPLTADLASQQECLPSELQAALKMATAQPFTTVARLPLWLQTWPASRDAFPPSYKPSPGQPRVHAPRLPKPARPAQLKTPSPQLTPPVQQELRWDARAELAGAAHGRSASRHLQQRLSLELEESWMRYRHQAEASGLHMLHSMRCLRRLPASCLTRNQPSGLPLEEEP